MTVANEMRVEDRQSKGSGWLIRLHEKGGKHHTMPCHHALAEALHAFIAPAGIATDRRAFCSAHRAGMSAQRSPTNR